MEILGAESTHASIYEPMHSGCMYVYIYIYIICVCVLTITLACGVHRLAYKCACRFSAQAIRYLLSCVDKNMCALRSRLLLSYACACVNMVISLYIHIHIYICDPYIYIYI